ncbi:RNA polymerase sigma factor [Ihubacter sp. rT4E-8]|uniref:RNA polymerase sigma factor n=1 Tax=Ihubacter sp. rT4E-8 TaxID=3242369 RepID=UPI003CED9A3A
MTEEYTEKLMEQLYEALHIQLIRWCRNMTGDQRTAEELVQEAFLRALLHEEIFKELSESQQRAWLYQTVKNLYIDHVRRGKWEMTVDRFPETQADSEISEEMFMVEWGELLTHLPKLERYIFVLRYLHGYTSGQIGTMLHMPAGTIRAKLHEARKRLRQVIGDR